MDKNHPSGKSLVLALIHDVFFDDDGADRLDARLLVARQRGAELAVLPELPLDSWLPATREKRSSDAEEPGGPRHQRLAEAARRAGIGVLGGAVVADEGRRFNRGLAFDAEGRLVATYDKIHLPCEEGFWESDHYEPGTAPPQRFDAFGLPLGVQICSDLNRPVGCHLLGAQGAAAILAPRATEPGTFERWLTVMRANAVTSCAYVVSVNRPRAEPGVPLGGPSVVIAPDGEVLVETEEPVTVARLEEDRVVRAQGEYPGYMGTYADLYAAGWSRLTG